MIALSTAFWSAALEAGKAAFFYKIVIKYIKSVIVLYKQALTQRTSSPSRKALSALADFLK